MRKLDLQKDYPTLEKWWASHNWPAVPREALPETGLIIDDMCAGFMYKTDSCLAWIEWIVANKEAPRTLRAISLQKLVKGLQAEAKAQGFTKVFSAVKHPNLIKLYQELGFMQTDGEMTHFVYTTGVE